MITPSWSKLVPFLRLLVFLLSGLFERGFGQVGSGPDFQRDDLGIVTTMMVQHGREVVAAVFPIVATSQESTQA